MFVAAIDVINAADFGDSVRFQSGKHERGRRAQIARHHRRAKEPINALDHGGWSLKIDMCAHAFELCHVHVALRKNVFGDDADSASGGKKRTHLCLHIGRKTGIWLGRELKRCGHAVGRNGYRIVRRFDFESTIAQRLGHGLNVLRLDPLDRDSVAANRARNQKSSGFDPIRNDVVLGAVQFLDAFHDNAAGAGAFNLRAHLVQKIREIDNFRFLSGAFDHGRPFCQRCRHHYVVGAENGRPKFAAQIDHRTGEFRRKHFDVAGFHPNGRTERFESLQVQVDRAIADDAAARQRNRRFLAAAEQRTDDANRSAHPPDNIIGRNRIDFRGRDRDRAAGAFHFRAEMLQNLQHVMRVAQVRHTVNRARFAGEQRRRQNRQGGILRAADFDRSA